MKIHSELANGLFLLERKTVADERGFFQRIFSPEDLYEFWGDRKICQVNRSFTKNKGVFRGFHFQKPPFAEMKFIQCTQGHVLDVAIDLRFNSPTFLQAFTYELSAKNNMCIIIPEGFAHGFQSLEDNSELIYFHSAPYEKDYEGGINYKDPMIDFKLPLPIGEISLRDQNFSYIDKNYKGIQL